MNKIKQTLNKTVTSLGLASAMGLMTLWAAHVRGEALAIVVHPDNHVNEISSTELRRIFRAEQQFWDNDTRITLLLRAPVSKERNVVLRAIYEMNEQDFKKYWIGKMFKAEVASGPKLVYTNHMALNLINAIPGSITFVPASKVQQQNKVLKIDGKLPGEPGYPLFLED